MKRIEVTWTEKYEVDKPHESSALKWPCVVETRGGWIVAYCSTKDVARRIVRLLNKDESRKAKAEGRP